MEVGLSVDSRAKRNLRLFFIWQAVGTSLLFLVSFLIFAFGHGKDITAEITLFLCFGLCFFSLIVWPFLYVPFFLSITMVSFAGMMGAFYANCLPQYICQDLPAFLVILIGGLIIIHAYFVLLRSHGEGLKNSKWPLVSMIIQFGLTFLFGYYVLPLV